MSTICFKRHHLFSTTNIQSIAYGKGIRHHFKKMLLILMDKWYHSLPTAGNCRQSPLRLSNPEPWFMRIGLFWMGMNFHTAFPNGQDSWILDAKQFFGQFVLINPQAESLPTAIGPRREDKIATGKVIVLHLAQMLHLKSQFFPKRKNPLRFLKKKTTTHFSPRQPCPRSYLPKSWLN